MFGKRFSRALAVTTVASLVMATAAFADDLDADADALATAVPHPNGLTANQQPGTTATYDLSALVDETGNPTDNVFPGSLVVTIARSGDWLAGGSPASFTFTAYDTNAAGTIQVTVPCGTTAGTSEIMSAVLTAGTSTNGKTLSPNSVTLNYTITAQGADDASCAPSNAAPTIAWTANPTSANEGDTKTYSFSITDAAADTHTFVTGYPDCGTGNTLVSSSIDNALNTGTFDCSFPDGLVPAQASAIKVQVQDDGTPSLSSNELSANTTVANVDPTVAAGFGASADCQTASTLTIDPDDLGVNDSPWKVNINWGDGNTEPEISRTDLDSFTVNHVYALAGNYNATVTIADKDLGSGSDAVNPITVNQTYTVDFLPPFDDSTPSGLIVNKMKNGRVVPVKATIFDDCALATLTDPNANVTIKVSKTSGTAGTADPVETYADAGESSAGTSSFRWSSDGFWIYNLDSKALGLVTNNFYRVDVYVGTVKATVDNWAVLQPVK
jgi:hypothetical protein